MQDHCHFDGDQTQRENNTPSSGGSAGSQHPSNEAFVEWDGRHDDARLIFRVAGMPPILSSDSLDTMLFSDSRCLIVDDSAAFCAAAKTVLFEAGAAVVGTAATSADAVVVANTISPQLIIVDIDLGAESGFDVVEMLSTGDRDPQPAIVLVSTHDETDFMDLIDVSSAVGFLPKFELSATSLLQLMNSPSRDT
ncbi:MULTISPECIES: response regulator [unclassified Rhodococcus (in: high G+C Gram-positive bacteria)]|uniref:response regulator n=1 Tax=unclassified Rhodococcus (in: high G+C Gram-positive bacteria) TaxID=192944 RepID=UPI0021BEC8DF|nr:MULTISPECIES: response regulator [unclassified Rhodococcus (in: high G+C Gram-positive bacteria)]